MSALVLDDVKVEGKRVTDEVPARKERRIVYLDNPSDRRPDAVGCIRITCPGHCACASKKK